MDINQIAIVDDTKLHQTIMMAAVKSLGLDIMVFDGGEQLIEYLSLGKRRMIVLMDHYMPGISGMDALMKIRETYDRIEIPIIFVTANDDPKGLIDALRAGANDFVTKPFVADVIRARVQIQLEVCRIMEENKRMQESDTVAKMVTTYNHELNNPLASAIGFLNMEFSANPNPSRNLKIIQTMLVRMSDIIQKIRNLEQIKDLETEIYSQDTKIFKIK